MIYVLGAMVALAFGFVFGWCCGDERYDGILAVLCGFTSLVLLLGHLFWR